MNRFGWIPDLPDKRDYKRFDYYPPTRIPLPSRVDLRPKTPAVYDQGELGSCTSNAIAGAIQYERIQQRLTGWVPSRLFIYYNERVMEGTVNSDSGAMIRDGIKSVAKIGACPETVWPYDVSRFTDRPSAKAYADAPSSVALRYLAVSQTQAAIKQCLAEGFPVIVGFAVYESFMTPDKYGNIPMPGADEYLLGGHAVMICGYFDQYRRWIMRNSWGKSWGVGGYAYLPYHYLTDPELASDFWSIELIGKAA